MIASGFTTESTFTFPEKNRGTAETRVFQEASGWQLVVKVVLASIDLRIFLKKRRDRNEKRGFSTDR
jgi:hypothetical protein